nr:hypothetical protein [Proteiniclasticum sp.]
MVVGKTDKIKPTIKETKYCSILAQGKVFDGEYTYCIEKIFVKELRQDEIRFSLYKDTMNQVERYIPRSLDVTEKEFLELFKESIKHGVFSEELLINLKTELVKKRQGTKRPIEKEEVEREELEEVQEEVQENEK